MTQNQVILGQSPKIQWVTELVTLYRRQSVTLYLCHTCKEECHWFVFISTVNMEIGIIKRARWLPRRCGKQNSGRGRTTEVTKGNPCTQRVSSPCRPAASLARNYLWEAFDRGSAVFGRRPQIHVNKFIFPSKILWVKVKK